MSAQLQSAVVIPLFPVEVGQLSERLIEPHIDFLDATHEYLTMLTTAARRDLGVQAVRLWKNTVEVAEEMTTIDCPVPVKAAAITLFLWQEQHGRQTSIAAQIRTRTTGWPSQSPAPERRTIEHLLRAHQHLDEPLNDFNTVLEEDQQVLEHVVEQRIHDPYDGTPTSTREVVRGIFRRRRCTHKPQVDATGWPVAAH